MIHKKEPAGPFSKPLFGEFNAFEPAAVILSPVDVSNERVRQGQNSGA